MRWLRGRRLGLGVLLVLALAATWWLHGPARGAAQAPWRARGYLLVGVPLWLPPLAAPATDGRWVGLAPALARGVAQAAMGNPGRVQILPLEPGQTTWALGTGGADMVIAGHAAAAPAGARLVGPYLVTPLALLVRRGQPLKAWAQLDGREVGVLAGRAALRKVAGPHASYVVEETDLPALAVRALALGRLRALVGPLPVLRAMAAYDPQLTVQTEAVLGVERYWVLVPAGAAALVPAVERAIAGLPAGEALERALALWASQAALPAPRPLLTLPSGAA